VRADPIAVVEAVYELEADTSRWLGHILDQARPCLDQGAGVAATIYRLNEGPDQATIASRGMSDAVLGALVHASVGNPDSHRIVGGGVPFATTTETLEKLGLTSQGARSHSSLVNFFHPLHVRDVLRLRAPEVADLTVLVVAPMRGLRRPSRPERSLWNRVAAHLGAGARLRGALGAPSGARDISTGAEAVLSPSGKLEHGLAPATAPRMRDSLRRAAIAIDRARTREGRANPNASLDLWQGLVAGRWSLVDRFDSDGRRFLVARSNDPDVPDPRALTRRERQVLAYAAMGQPLKLIAYALGLSVSTIALHRGRAMRKLGLTSTAEVVGMFAQEAAKETVA
jgi:DNA-binding CsgD family transcriptional regulator